MLEKDITITNRLGLHARASAKLVQALHGFQAATSIAYRGKEVNAKSIMGVMMLAAGLGTPTGLIGAMPEGGAQAIASRGEVPEDDKLLDDAAMEAGTD